MIALGRLIAGIVLLFGGLVGNFGAHGVPDARAQTMLWVSPYFLRAEQANQLVVESGLINGGVMIRPLFVGTYWATVPIRLPSNLAMNRVFLCYRTSNSRSFITQVRTTLMREPTGADIEIDDATDLTSTAPVCVFTSGLTNPFDGALTLAILLDFADLADTIHIGGIAIGMEPYTVDAPEGRGAASLQLRQNVPNPFAGETVIEFRVPVAGEVSIRIYDVSGRAVRDLVAGERSPGVHRRVWDGRDDEGERLPAGVYFYQARVGERTDSKRMVLAR